MAQEVIDTGVVANDGTGDTLRVAFTKSNANFTELYSWMSGGGDTAAEILAKLITVDGAGSGLDADLLDGLSSAAFATAVHSHAQSEVTGLVAALAAKLDSSSYTAADVLTKLLTVDGSGSGIDADLLDGMSSAAFAAASHAHAQSDVTGLVAALAAKLDASAYTAADVLTKLLTVDGAGSGLDADLLDGLSSAAFAAAVHTHAVADVTGLQAALDAKLDEADYTAADVLAKLLTVDGAASGLDADLLDGMSSAAFAAASHSHAIADVTGLQAALDAKLASASYTAADVLTKLLTVDGAGSGLDADLLDGLSSAAFFQTAAVLLAIDGSAAAPSYSWATDPDNGLYLDTAFSANAIGVAFAGTQRMRLDGNGLWVMSALPALLLVETDQAADEQLWRLSANARSIQFRAMNDARTLTADAFNFSRGTGSTPTITAITFGNTTDNPTSNFLGTGTKTFGGAILAAAGTVALPGISFSADPDLGLYRIGANNLGISCGNSLVLDIAQATFAITATTVRFNTTSATTVGAAGGASALPATPLGYITTNVNGTACKIPYYNT